MQMVVVSGQPQLLFVPQTTVVFHESPEDAIARTEQVLQERDSLKKAGE